MSENTVTEFAKGDRVKRRKRTWIEVDGGYWDTGTISFIASRGRSGTNPGRAALVIWDNRRQSTVKLTALTKVDAAA